MFVSAQTFVIERMVLGQSSHVKFCFHQVDNTDILSYYLRLKSVFLVCLSFYIQVTQINFFEIDLYLYDFVIIAKIGKNFYIHKNCEHIFLTKVRLSYCNINSH